MQLVRRLPCIIPLGKQPLGGRQTLILLLDFQASLPEVILFSFFWSLIVQVTEAILGIGSPGSILSNADQWDTHGSKRDLFELRDIG